MEAYYSTPGNVESEPLVNGGVWTRHGGLRHYRNLRIKYERASWSPWRSVEPDPPLPGIVPPF